MKFLLVERGSITWSVGTRLSDPTAWTYNHCTELPPETAASSPTGRAGLASVLTSRLILESGFWGWALPAPGPSSVSLSLVNQGNISCWLTRRPGCREPGPCHSHSEENAVISRQDYTRVTPLSAHLGLWVPASSPTQGTQPLRQTKKTLTDRMSCRGEREPGTGRLLGACIHCVRAERCRLYLGANCRSHSTCSWCLSHFEAQPSWYSSLRGKVLWASHCRWRITHIAENSNGLNWDRSAL